MKRIWKLILAIIAVLAIGIGTFNVVKYYEPYNLMSIKNDPAAQLKKSFEKTIDALEEGLIVPTSDAIPQSLKNGVVGFNLATGDGNKLTSSFYLRENSFAVIGDLTTTEQDPNHFGVWASDEAVAIDLPVVLGNNAYGFSPKTLKEDLKNSALLEMLGISYEEAVEMLESAGSMTPNNENEGSDWKTLLETKQKLENLIHSCTVSVTEGKLSEGTETIKAFNVAYTLTPKQLCEALDIVVNWLVNTENYQTYTKNIDDMTENLMETVENAKEAIQGSNATAIVSFYLHGNTQIIMKSTLRIDWMVEEQPSCFTASINFGSDPVQSLLYSAEMTLDVPEEGKNTVRLEYHRSHAHNLPGRTLVLTTPDESYTVMELQYNSMTNAFDASFMDREFTISGLYKSEAEKLTISLDLENEGEVTLTFIPQAEMPAVPAYKNLCTLTMDELAQLSELLPNEEPTPDMGEKEVDITITGNDGMMSFFYMTHDYNTVGELLVAEGIALLDEQGNILSICDEDFDGDTWDVYIHGELVEGSLFDAELGDYASIEIEAIVPEEF